ncbi:hypothetical protein GA0070216_10620 [Micromonospora matsumotoense]|uniref:Uncharacterized protein n=1 Tax=Micromonospora matsumotoense TaxID=121616 RepID=A0A1C4YAL4_9ACTN|nr:hypothetical protein [Micromonospora matsumotoense]SCF17686.1 hypothetical protein GA0070216_10620 [Micromonospora matsumotoense]
MSDIADPSRHLVLTMDVERYSGRDNVLQWRVQQALPRIMQRAREKLGPIGVHEGLVHLDGDNGFPGEAVVTACRLVDSPQLKAALRRFPDAQVALIVSDRLYQDVSRHYGDPRPAHFLRVTAGLPEKSAEQPLPATAPVQPSAGGQTFRHITAHGPAAFGNGNVITTYGSAGGATPHRP